MPLRAVLFDIGDTLWYTAKRPDRESLRRAGAESAARALASFGLQHDDPSEVATVAWRAANRGLVYARRDLVEPDYEQLVRDDLCDLGLRLTSDQAGDLLRAIYVSGVDGGKTAFADARPTLDALVARGFRLGIVTNRAIGGEHFRRDLAEAGLDIDWQVIAVSVEVGHPKPHPAPFLAALRSLEVGPSEALMVGNSLAEDIAGAHQLGIATAWRRSEPDTGDQVEPDYTFGEVGELLDIDVLRGAA